MSRRDRRQNRRRKRAVKAAASGLQPAEQTGPLELFRAGRRREVTVRCLQVLVLLMVPVALWGAHDIAFNGPGILNQRGELVSWAVRYATAAFLFVVGAGGAIGIIVYGWCYVTHAVWDGEAGRCRLTLLGFIVPVRVDMPPTGEPRYLHRDGFAHARGIVVHAPYYSIRIPGRRLPVIVDEQGEFRHGDLFHRVFLGSSQLEIMTARAARRRTST
jgi:hypothetical protein